jgi:hypothetical protein
MPDLKEYIQTTEAAAQFNYHVEHVCRLMREGSLHGIKIGRIRPVQKNLDGYVARIASMSKHNPR